MHTQIDWVWISLAPVRHLLHRHSFVPLSYSTAWHFTEFVQVQKFSATVLCYTLRSTHKTVAQTCHCDVNDTKINYQCPPNNKYFMFGVHMFVDNSTPSKSHMIQLTAQTVSVYCHEQIRWWRHLLFVTV